MVQAQVRLLRLFLTSKQSNMTTAKLSEYAIEMLVGRTIHSASDNWIKLDNGLVIYLDDSEIEHIND
jgi:hypothetical protein